MPATLETITPTHIKAGQTLILAGAGFLPGCVVWFNAPGISTTAPAAWVASGDVRVVVPDLYEGGPGECEVSVANAGEAASAALLLTIEPEPEVSTVHKLTSLAAVSRLIGVTSSETLDERRLGELIEIASAQIAGECGADFRIGTFIESLDGDGTELLRLKHGPAVTVIDLLIDGVPVPTSDVMVYARYIKFETRSDYDARLRDDRRVFPVGTQNIVVTYQAGYGYVPADISHACALQVLHLLNTAPKTGVLNEGNQAAGLSTAWSQQTLAPAVQTVCNRYKPRKVGVV